MKCLIGSGTVDGVAVALVDDGRRKRRLGRDEFHFRLARRLRIEREDARLPEVALHLLDQPRIDALTRLILEGDPRLLLLADDSWHHLAVHLQTIAAHNRIDWNRKLEIALHDARVRIGKNKTHLHALEIGVLLDDRLGLLDGNRLLVCTQIDGANHRRLDWRRNHLRSGRCRRNNRYKNQSILFHSNAPVNSRTDPKPLRSQYATSPS